MSDEIQQGEDVQEDIDQAAQYNDSENSGVMNPALFTKPFHFPPLTPKAQFEAEMAQLEALGHMLDRLFR